MGKIVLPCKFGEYFEWYTDLSHSKWYRRGIFYRVSQGLFNKYSYYVKKGSEWDYFDSADNHLTACKPVFVTPFRSVIYNCPFEFGCSYDVSLYFNVKSKHLIFKQIQYDVYKDKFVYYFIESSYPKWHFFESDVMLGNYEDEEILINEHNPKGAGRKNKFSDDVVELIIQKAKEGISYRNLAKEFGCSVGLISKLMNA